MINVTLNVLTENTVEERQKFDEFFKLLMEKCVNLKKRYKDLRINCFSRTDGTYETVFSMCFDKQYYDDSVITTDAEKAYQFLKNSSLLQIPRNFKIIDNLSIPEEIKE